MSSIFFANHLLIKFNYLMFKMKHNPTVPALHVVVLGFGIHWLIDGLQTNCCVVNPPGNVPLEQIKVCTVFVLVAVKAFNAPVTIVA